jgi:hypothetical protein
VPFAGPAWLPYAALGWYLGRLDLSPEMTEAFYIEATDYGRVANRSFDLLEFARRWNIPVTVVASGDPPRAASLQPRKNDRIGP